jgi:tetratricopeptide (TPR) repeat protein
MVRDIKRICPIIILILISIPHLVSGDASTFKKAHEAFLNEQYENAIILYTNFLKQANRESEEAVKALIELSQAYFELGMQYFQREEYEFARQLFYSANSPEADTMLSKCVFEIAKGYFEKGDLNQALELYKSIDTKEAREGASTVLCVMAENEFKEKHFAKACSLYCESGTQESIEGAAKCLSVLAERKGYELGTEKIRKWADEIELESILSMGFDKFISKVKREEEAIALLKEANGYYMSGKYWEAEKLYGKILDEYIDTQVIPEVRDKLEKCAEKISQIEEEKRQENLLRKLESSSLSDFLSQSKDPYFSSYEIALVEVCLNEAPLGIRFIIDEQIGLSKSYGSLTYYGKLYAILKLLDATVGQVQLARAGVLYENLYIPISIAEKLARFSYKDLE